MHFPPHKGNYDSTGGSKSKIKVIKKLIQVGIFLENVKHALIHPHLLLRVLQRRCVWLSIPEDSFRLVNSALHKNKGMQFFGRRR